MRCEWPSVETHFSIKACGSLTMSRPVLVKVQMGDAHIQAMVVGCFVLRIAFNNRVVASTQALRSRNIDYQYSFEVDSHTIYSISSTTNT